MERIPVESIRSKPLDTWTVEKHDHAFTGKAWERSIYARIQSLGIIRNGRTFYTRSAMSTFYAIFCHVPIRHMAEDKLE